MKGDPIGFAGECVPRSLKYRLQRMAAYSCFLGYKLIINPHASKLASDYEAFDHGIIIILREQ